MAKPDTPIAAILVRARERAGLPQADLARRLKFSVAEIAHIEAGHVVPSLRTMDRWSQAVGGRLVMSIVQSSSAAL